MEQYFTPVHNFTQEGAKVRKHQHPHNHSHHQQHHHHPHERTLRRVPASHRPGPGDDRAYQQEHNNHDHNFQGYHALDNHRGEDPHGVLRSPSSSSLSTSSTGSSSWSSEQSLDDSYHMHMHKPPHSLSCSNIAEPRYRAHAWDSEDMEFDMRSATQYEQPRSPRHQPHQQAHGRRRHSRPHSGHSEGHGHGGRLGRLHRGQSKSEEGLLHSIDSDEEEEDGWGRHPHDHQGALYKTASLGQNLGFGGDQDGLGEGRAMPKKSASTMQLPTKGILKNKDGGAPGDQRPNFRKTKSMEVLSNRQKAGRAAAEAGGGAGGPGASKTASIEALREDFVKTKLQFSAFLDEITRQVISPQRLNSLGVASAASPTAPKSPNQERREPPGGVKREEHAAAAQQSKQQRPAKSGSHSSAKSSSDSQSHPHPGPYTVRQHGARQEPSNRPHSAGHRHHHHHHGNHKKRYSMVEQLGAPLGDKLPQEAQHDHATTDGTSTSPETALHEAKHPHHPKQHENRHATPGGVQSPPQHPHGEHKGSPPPLTQAPAADSESPSSKSSSASHSSGHGAAQKHGGHRRPSRPHRDSLGSADRLQVLEQYNKELHENLLQTVACIENMESELQCTKTELAGLRDKHKRLQESYTTSQQSSSALEQKLQSSTESMNSERRYLLHRILELTKQLDSARHTINSLENVNVPALIKELLQKHFKSEEDFKTFLRCTTVKENKDNQSSWKTVDVSSSEWSLPRQGSSDSGRVRMTAFMPWRQESCEWASSADDEELTASARRKPFPFTIAEIRMALFNNTKEVPSRGVSEHSPSVIEVPPNPYEDTLAVRPVAGAGGGDAGPTDPGVDVSSATAQKILDNFMRQMACASTTEGQEASGSNVID